MQSESPPFRCRYLYFASSSGKSFIPVMFLRARVPIWDAKPRYPSLKILNPNIKALDEVGSGLVEANSGQRVVTKMLHSPPSFNFLRILHNQMWGDPGVRSTTRLKEGDLQRGDCGLWKPMSIISLRRWAYVWCPGGISMRPTLFSVSLLHLLRSIFTRNI